MRGGDAKDDEEMERLNMKGGPSRRRVVTGTGLVSASAAASALLAACSSSSSSASTKGSGAAKEVAGNFPTTPAWQFWFVNHVYSNPFLLPTQDGFADAPALLRLPTPKWGGRPYT